MFNWLRRLLGVQGLCDRHGFLASGPDRPACAACEGYTQGYAAGNRDAQRLAAGSQATVIGPDTRKPGKPRRYDQVNRDRARPRKAPHSV